MSPEAGVVSVLALFFYTTIWKLLLTRVPLSASQTSCLLNRMFEPGDCQTPRSALDICASINIAQSPNAGHRQTRLILSTEGHEGLSYATVLFDYASVERQWGKSGETLTSSDQRLLKSNQICLSFEILHQSEKNF